MRANTGLTGRRLRRAGGASLALTAAGLVVASSASAHVSIVEESAVAGDHSVVTFSVPHGCDGAATTGVRIQIPESIASVTPTVNPNWTVEKVMEELDTPIEGGHGEQITERVGEVAYQATTPLEEGFRDTFELSLRVPEDAAGSTLWFPVVQQCGDAEMAWIEIPADEADEPELPAPGLAVAAAGEDAAADDPAGDDPADEGTAGGETDSDDGSDDGGSNGWGIAGLGTGVVGIALGAVALARTRQS